MATGSIRFEEVSSALCAVSAQLGNVRQPAAPRSGRPMEGGLGMYVQHDDLWLACAPPETAEAGVRTDFHVLLGPPRQPARVQAVFRTSAGRRRKVTAKPVEAPDGSLGFRISIPPYTEGDTVETSLVGRVGDAGHRSLPTGPRSRSRSGSWHRPQQIRARSGSKSHHSVTWASSR
jgi:hypothetical protein